MSQRLQVLHLEDEPLIQRFVKISTTSCCPDSEVISSDCPEALVEHLQDTQEEVLQILISDLNLPNCWGGDFVRKARSMRPNLPIIIMSSDHISAHDIKKQMIEGSKNPEEESQKTHVVEKGQIDILILLIQRLRSRVSSIPA